MIGWFGEENFDSILPQYVLESSNKTNFIAHPYKPEKLSIEYSPIAF